jgi:two-component system heavy metal sensor histidine kinase CusS
MSMTNSIRFKTSILYTSVLGCILVALSVVNFLSLRSLLFHNLDSALMNDALQVQTMLELFEELDMSHVITFDMFDRAFSSGMREAYAASQYRKIRLLRRWWEEEASHLRLRKRFVSVFDMSRNLLVDMRLNGGPDLEFILRQVDFNKDSVAFETVRFNGEKIRTVNYPFRYKNRFLYVVQLGVSMTPAFVVLNTFLFYALVAVAAILIITLFMGRFIAARVLDPVDQVVSLANSISHQDLSGRLTLGNTDAEMKNLVDSFNTMLDRLQRSFAQIHDFSSHVAHELKTPLAIIKGELEVALMSDRPLDEYKQVMTLCLEEVDRQIRIVDDLLFLARAEYRTDIFHFERVSLKEFVHDVHEQFGMVALEKGHELVLDDRIDRELFVNIDKPHLRRLLFNLLNNAVKYSYKGSKIELSVSSDKSNGFIMVKDSGRGIATEHIGRIFDKFYRVPNVEANESFSCGLGLSIASSIARVHSGSLSVESEPGRGSVFTVSIPLYD